MRRFPPQRLICLTEETVETIYLLAFSDPQADIASELARAGVAVCRS